MGPLGWGRQLSDNECHMLQKNELVPDIEIEDLTGKKYRLWDFRQKTHVLVLFGDGAAAAEIAFAEKKKTMEWLGLRVIACGAPPAGFEPGATAIDRYGRVIGAWPFDVTLADRVEKELVYYEARHC
jgi:hypothetical protein